MTPSLREPPALQMSVSLWQRIVVEGFLTKQEPLVVHMENPASDEKLNYFSVGHTKSQGRSLSLLAFLWYCYKHAVVLQDFATRQPQCVMYFSFSEGKEASVSALFDDVLGIDSRCPSCG